MTSPPDIDEKLLDEALAWHAALEADNADWEGYTLWLEADPRHRRASDIVALTDRMVDDHRGRLADLVPDGEIEPALTRRVRRPLLIGTIASAIAAAIVLPIALRPAADVTYDAGATARRIVLAGGVAVDLGPASTLVARGGGSDRLALTRGEGYFTVAHDPTRTLSIQAGEYAIRDIGTTFSVNLAKAAVTIGVADGRVAITRDGSDGAIGLGAGQQLIARANGPAAVSAVASTDVGSWRQGRLTYGNAPLSIVAADVSRYIGKDVDVDATIADRRFSGVLTIGDGSKLLPTLGQVMALSYTVDGDHIRLAAAPTR